MILFAKAPVPGRVKTRLAGVADGDGETAHAHAALARAADLHAAFVMDTIEKLVSFRDLADIELHTDTPTDAWARCGVTRQTQAAGDLGLKLLYAIEHGLAMGRAQVLILGSDAPTLPRAHLERLLDRAADVTLGPCADGGYYAIACRRSHPDMFAGVRWSTADALAGTESAARACGLTVERGEPWYDVDEPDDLARLMAEPDLPRHTAAVIRSMQRAGG